MGATRSRRTRFSCPGDPGGDEWFQSQISRSVDLGRLARDLPDYLGTDILQHLPPRRAPRRLHILGCHRPEIRHSVGNRLSRLQDRLDRGSLLGPRCVIVQVLHAPIRKPCGPTTRHIAFRIRSRLVAGWVAGLDATPVSGQVPALGIGEAPHRHVCRGDIGARRSLADGHRPRPGAPAAGLSRGRLFLMI